MLESTSNIIYVEHENKKIDILHVVQYLHTKCLSSAALGSQGAPETKNVQG